LRGVHFHAFLIFGARAAAIVSQTKKEL
jgi:hypothetical protein